MPLNANQIQSGIKSNICFWATLIGNLTHFWDIVHIACQGFSHMIGAPVEFVCVYVLKYRLYGLKMSIKPASGHEILPRYLFNY